MDGLVEQAKGKVKMGSDENRILIMTAVAAERDAVLRGLNSSQNQYQNIDVIIAGVGPVAAAANTAKALAAKEYGWVISTGIGGGFPGRAEVGTLVIASEIVSSDLGVETREGFSSFDELGFGSTRIPVDANLVNRMTGVLQEAKLSYTIGPIITVSTATGTAATTEEMLKRVPGAAAEGMEGYGVALAAHIFAVPVLEIRSISNRVGPRDRNAWRIKEALDVLAKAYSILWEGLR